MINNNYEYIFNNFKIFVEIDIDIDECDSIKSFDEWYSHLVYDYNMYRSKEQPYYNIKLEKIVNIQKNIISEIHFILDNHGEYKILSID